MERRKGEREKNNKNIVMLSMVYVGSLRQEDQKSKVFFGYTGS